MSVEQSPSSYDATRLPRDADHVVIAYNPSAGSRDSIDAATLLSTRLREEAFQVEAIPNLDELSSRAAELLEMGRLRAVVGAGGDGTAAELINRTPAGTPFVMLPGGTENLLSKYLRQPRGVEPVVERIREGLVARLDAGQVTNSLHRGGRLFMLVASCGIDADVVHRLAAGRQGHIRHWSYVKPIWESIRNYRYPEVRVQFRNDQLADHRQTEAWQTTQACWAVVTNLPRYARGLKFAPAAIGTDGLFDLCTFHKGSLLNGLKYLSGVVIGKHEKLGDCNIFKATHIRFESNHGVPLQIDGDPGGTLPIEIQIVRSRLSLLVSNHWAAEQGIATR